MPRLDPARCQLTGDITMLPSLDAEEVERSFASAEALQHTRRQGYGHGAAVPTAWSRPSSARTASTSVTVLAAAAAAARTHANAAAGLARA